MLILTSETTTSLSLMHSLTSGSLPGADVIAKKTGAIVIGNGEAINVLSEAGVAAEQLVPVAGGERIPLFTKEVREEATKGLGEQELRPPGAPPLPHHSRAAAIVHVWPSLHCFMPGKTHADVPDFIDTGTRYFGAAHDFVCTLDITFGMKYGLLKLGDHIPKDKMDSKTKAFVDYVEDREAHKFSHFDGGQLMYNFLTESKTILWSAHLGGYEGILKQLQPQPNVAIMAIAGRANFNGRPFDGSAAEFAVQKIKWIGEPQKVIWCLHDER
jgi:hypothetical protein